MKNKPVIGMMALGLIGYWPQFPGMKEYLEARHKELIKKIGDRAEIVDIGMVDTVEISRQAGIEFKAADADIVFCQAMTYATSDNLIPAIKDLDIPIILLNVQEDKVLDFKEVKNLDDWLGHGCTCAGVAEHCAMLNRYEKRFDIVTGYLNGDEILDAQINKWITAASVRRKLRTSNIGLLGRQYMGMMDLYVDENEVMKKFGIMTKFLLWDEVLFYADKVTKKEKEESIQLLYQIFDVPETVGKSEIDNIGVMYGGYRKMVEEKDLCILANHFEKEMVGREIDLMAALNPAHTMLTKNGIACTVEGDIKGALAMTMLKQVGGNANLTELYSMDFEDDICIIGHSGASDPDIADIKPVLKTTNVFHGKSGKGFTTQVLPREGAITMLALTMKADSSFKMVVAEGMVEKGEILNLGDTNCRVRFPIPMREFINRWSLQGPSHHGVMGSGSHAETLKAVAKELGIEIQIVTEN